MGFWLRIELLSLQEGHPVSCQLLGVGVNSAPAAIIRMVSLRAGCRTFLGLVLGLGPQLVCLLLIKPLGTGSVLLADSEGTH